MADIDATLRMMDLTLSDSISEDESYEISKYRKMEMVFNALKDLDVQKLENIDDTGRENLKKAIRSILVNNIAGKGSGKNIYINFFFENVIIIN